MKKKMIAFLGIFITLLICSICLIPGIINFVFDNLYGEAIGEKKDWIDFSGNILATIFSVLLAIYITRIQLEEDKKNTTYGALSYFDLYLSDILLKIDSTKKITFNFIGSEKIYNFEKINCLSEKYQEELFRDFFKNIAHLEYSEKIYRIFSTAMTIDNVVYNIMIFSEKRNKIYEYIIKKMNIEITNLQNEISINGETEKLKIINVYKKVFENVERSKTLIYSMTENEENEVKYIKDYIIQYDILIEKTLEMCCALGIDKIYDNTMEEIMEILALSSGHTSSFLNFLSQHPKGVLNYTIPELKIFINEVIGNIKKTIRK